MADHSKGNKPMSKEKKLRNLVKEVLQSDVTLYMQMGKRCKELSEWNKEKDSAVAYQKAGAYDELKSWIEKVRELEEKYYKLRYGNDK